MADKRSLTNAIRDALQFWRMQSALSFDHIRKLASLALTVNEEAITFLAGREFAHVGRTYLALQLLRASTDHGRGLLFLLRANPQDMGGPALALHRSQIENFLRGCYLGFIASDEQLDDFLDEDKGVREKTANNKWRGIGVEELAQYVTAFINSLDEAAITEDPEKFTRMVENAWSPLCGMVHGGRAVRAMYDDGEGVIGSNIPLDAIAQAISNCYVVTNFSFLVILARILELEGIPENCELSKAMTAFVSYHRELKARGQLA